MEKIYTAYIIARNSLHTGNHETHIDFAVFLFCILKSKNPEIYQNLRADNAELEIGRVMTAFGLPEDTAEVPGYVENGTGGSELYIRSLIIHLINDLLVAEDSEAITKLKDEIKNTMNEIRQSLERKFWSIHSSQDFRKRIIELLDTMPPPN